MGLLRLSTGVVGQFALSVVFLVPSSASAVTLYAEPTDLPGSIFSPRDLGAVSAGLNTVTGGLSAIWFEEFPSVGEWFGDTLDAFAYQVPIGLVVTDFELVVTNFNSNVGSAFGQGVSTTSGVDTPFFPFNTTVPNLLTDGEPLEDGAYTYGLQIAPTCLECSSGNLSYDWEINITAELIGDLNGDGFVGIDDLGIVLANWNLNVPPGDVRADPSGDGFVGIDDLNEVLGNWNAGTPPTGGANVPEPTTAGLLAVGVFGVAGLRARQGIRGLNPTVHN